MKMKTKQTPIEKLIGDRAETLAQAQALKQEAVDAAAKGDRAGAMALHGEAAGLFSFVEICDTALAELQQKQAADDAAAAAEKKMAAAAVARAKVEENTTALLDLLEAAQDQRHHFGTLLASIEHAGNVVDASVFAATASAPTEKSFRGTARGASLARQLAIDHINALAAVVRVDGNDLSGRAAPTGELIRIAAQGLDATLREVDEHVAQALNPITPAPQSTGAAKSAGPGQAQGFDNSFLGAMSRGELKVA
jgi:hypothetical protein